EDQGVHHREDGEAHRAFVPLNRFYASRRHGSFLVRCNAQSTQRPLLYLWVRRLLRPRPPPHAPPHKQSRRPRHGRQAVEEQGGGAGGGGLVAGQGQHAALRQRDAGVLGLEALLCPARDRVGRLDFERQLAEAATTGAFALLAIVADAAALRFIV